MNSFEAAIEDDMSVPLVKVDRSRLKARWHSAFVHTLAGLSVLGFASHPVADIMQDRCGASASNGRRRPVLRHQPALHRFPAHAPLILLTSRIILRQARRSP